MGALKLSRFVVGVGEFLLGLYIIGHVHTSWRISRIDHRHLPKGIGLACYSICTGYWSSAEDWLEMSGVLVALSFSNKNGTRIP